MQAILERNTMSAFTAKEVAALSGNANVVDIKINALKTFIAGQYPDQAKWDQMYIMAWQVLSAMQALSKRATTDRVIWNWGIPFTPRSYHDINQQEVPVRCIASSESDERHLTGVWKHEREPLMGLLYALADRKPQGVMDEFEIDDLSMRDVDFHGKHVVLEWHGKNVEHLATHRIFLITKFPTKTTDRHGGKGAVDGDYDGNTHRPRSFDKKVNVGTVGAVSTPTERTYRTPAAKPARPAFQMPLSGDGDSGGRKHDNAKRHARRKQNHRRNRYDD